MDDRRKRWIRIVALLLVFAMLVPVVIAVGASLGSESPASPLGGLALLLA